ncbi:MAG: glycoside hydrolase family 5 protein [Ktedonobacteraceae bacterium]
MKNSQPTGPLSKRNKFSGRLRLLVGFLVVVVILAIVFVVLAVQKQLFNGGTPPQSQTSATVTTPVGPGCGGGVTKNSDGTYHFPWLHVDSKGDIVDPNNCIVHLLGWNSVGAFLGNGGSLGKSGGNPLVHINLVRVAFNSRWYESDVYVPDQRMHYKAWMQKIVSTLESRGDYVMLDVDTAFFEPPCGNDGMGTNITFCPAQGQGDKDYSNPSSPYYHNAGGLELYQPIAVQALTDLAKLYVNDPAVLFDVWNEPGGYIFITPNSAQSKVADMNERINDVRQYDPQALIFVFSAGLKEDLSYKQSNLVFDFHDYPAFKGTSPVTHTTCDTSGSNLTKQQQNFTALRNAGRALFIGEWGGCYNIPSYNQQILSLAKTYNVGLTYFQEGNLFTKSKGTKQLNGNGLLVQQDYNILFGSSLSLRSGLMQAR